MMVVKEFVCQCMLTVDCSACCIFGFRYESPLRSSLSSSSSFSSTIVPIFAKKFLLLLPLSPSLLLFVFYAFVVDVILIVVFSLICYDDSGITIMVMCLVERQIYRSDLDPYSMVFLYVFVNVVVASILLLLLLLSSLRDFHRIEYNSAIILFPMMALSS